MEQSFSNNDYDKGSQLYELITFFNQMRDREVAEKENRQKEK